jgi:hypothetical protein
MLQDAALTGGDPVVDRKTLVRQGNLSTRYGRMIRFETREVITSNAAQSFARRLRKGQNRDAIQIVLPQSLEVLAMPTDSMGILGPRTEDVE